MGLVFRPLESANGRPLTISLELMLVAFCFARYRRNTAIAMHPSNVMAKCGKTCSSGYAEVTKMVADNIGEPSPADARETTHDVMKIAILNNSGMDATVRNKPRTCTIKLAAIAPRIKQIRSEEHTSELQSRGHLVCRLLLEKKKKQNKKDKDRDIEQR